MQPREIVLIKWEKNNRLAKEIASFRLHFKLVTAFFSRWKQQQREQSLLMIVRQPTACYFHQLVVDGEIER